MMQKLVCPNCSHHHFEAKPLGLNHWWLGLEKILLFVGMSPNWFNNVLILCKTCKYYWKA